MVAVPRLDLEAVDEALPEDTDHIAVGRRAQVGVALEALEQHVEALAEVAGSEVVEARRAPVASAISTSLLGYRSISCSGCGPDRSVPPHAGTRPANRPGTGR